MVPIVNAYQNKTYQQSNDEKNIKILKISKNQINI